MTNSLPSFTSGPYHAFPKVRPEFVGVEVAIGRRTRTRSIHPSHEVPGADVLPLYFSLSETP